MFCFAPLMFEPLDELTHNHICKTLVRFGGPVENVVYRPHVSAQRKQNALQRYFRIFKMFCSFFYHQYIELI